MKQCYPWKSFFVAAVFVGQAFFGSLTVAETVNQPTAQTTSWPVLDGPVEFFYSPFDNAHQPIVDAIDSAQKTVDVVLFHLSDPFVGQALMFAAKRGVQVRVLFDKGQWRNPADQKLTQDMIDAGVKVVQASSGFSITHNKAMVIDSKKAVISTMNLVRSYMKMLDYGIITYDRSVITEMNTVFEADLKNVQDNSNFTPPLSDPNLLWSPVNSKDKLLEFIGSAKKSVHLTVENLGNPDVLKALEEASTRGVEVHVLVPKCGIGKSNYNWPFVDELRKNKVDAKVVPGPASSDVPYVHAKSMVVDSERMYIGSENFSNNSLLAAREVGILFPDTKIADHLEQLFSMVWAKSEVPPEDPNYTCSAFDPIGQPVFSAITHFFDFVQ